MLKKLKILTLILLALWLFTLPAFARQAELTAYLNSAFSLIKKEYFEEPPQIKLLNSALMTLNQLNRAENLKLPELPLLPEDLSPEKAWENFAARLEQIPAPLKPQLKEKIKFALLSGMLEGLGDGLSYLEKPGAEKNSLADLGYAGVGMLIEDLEKEGKIIITVPFWDSPARKAGLLPGDEILKVDDKPVKGLKLQEAGKLIRGKTGKPVKLTICRQGQIKTYRLLREPISYKMSESRMLSPDLGYLWIYFFPLDAYYGKCEVCLEVAKMKQKGVKGLILDLRWNHGGALEAARGITELFIPPNQPFATLAYKDKESTLLSYAGEQLFDMPVVVLVNSFTEDSAEVVAGALKDNQRALLVGEKTAGKAAILEDFALEDGAKIFLPTGKILTPKGETIWKNGIQPDYPLPESQMQLQKAIELLKP